MPSTITHAYFSMDIYDRLDKKKQKILEPFKSHFKIFAQGPDIFFFYNLLSLRSGKKIRKLAIEMQRHNTQLFFINLITMMKDKNLYKKPELKTFLYGTIAHYVLDMTIHPYIIFKTGIYNKKDKKSIKYFGGHELMEAYIDAYFIKTRNKVIPKNFKSHTFCFDKVKISNDTQSMIDNVFFETYNVDKMGGKYITSIKQMKLLYKLFRNDKTGIKKIIYMIAEIIPFNLKLRAISYNIDLNKNEYYLNLNKESWHHPVDVSMSYNYSFIELYSIALFRAVNLINDVDKFFTEKKDINYLYKLFPNLSYATGLNCTLGNGQYFSF